MKQSRIRTGVVGVGYLGRLHARVLTEIPEAEVIGFVEPNDERAQEVVSNLGLRRFDTVEALSSEVECAVIATPTVLHAEVATTLMESGCDVMIEKPITDDPGSARRLIEIGESTGRIIQIGHVERYNPAIQATAPIVRNPRYIEAQRIGVFSARSLDIDVLLDLMIHDLQLVISLLGKEIVSIEAIGVPVLTEKVDMANVRLEMEDGSVANLVASRVSNEKMRKFRIFGRDAYISVDTKDQEVKGYRLVRHDGEPRIEELVVEVERKEPLRAELDAFLHCVRFRETPLVSGQDGLAALELALRVGEKIEASTRKS
ncbi:MAG: Gfo/Idh/MocA family oxidoreductase [Acidobacteria bacterium]|nr:Gfo/Idh/MocA family oxidoreductase [Acidobacteriota bacterium]